MWPFPKKKKKTKEKPIPMFPKINGPIAPVPHEMSAKNASFDGANLAITGPYAPHAIVLKLARGSEENMLDMIRYGQRNNQLLWITETETLCYFNNHGELFKLMFVKVE